ncbi:unnamed protein product [Bathycoccus prasinos]
MCKNDATKTNDRNNTNNRVARCWARASCRRPGLVLLVCLLSIGFASRAVYERRSTVVVDVKLTAYRARLTTHSDRDETFLAARKHLIEEQGKRKYFYRGFRWCSSGAKEIAEIPCGARKE